MNVLHINQSDISGGASIAGFRLHEGLLAEGVDSRLLVGDMTLEDERVAALPAPSFLDRQTSRVAWRMGLNYVNLTSSFAIRKHPFYKRADILNLHNLHGGYFNYLSVRSLTEIKPAVFTLHDMWSFTGHCAYSYDCGGWERGCGQCPYLSTTPPVKRDSTRLEWRLKNWVYNGSNLEIVAPSRWLAEQARRSLLKRFPVHHIPYGLDLKIYRPLDADQSRRELGIPAGKKVLMFGAQMLSDQRKGGDLLLEALQGLPASLKSGIVLLTLGQGGEALAATTGMRTIHLGYLSGDAQKVRAYSAADLFIFPTPAGRLWSPSISEACRTWCVRARQVI
jgi:glycosyltransferase involved in cell wall biosynthesis